MIHPVGSKLGASGGLVALQFTEPERPTGGDATSQRPTN